MKKQYAHWETSGTFPVAIAGTSHHRETIESIAKNADGVSALVICLADIELDKFNNHDRNAVRISVSGNVVGYLKSEFASTYRDIVESLPEEIKSTTAMAAITGGLRSNGKEYEYRIELDIPTSFKIFLLDAPMELDVTRINGYPPLIETRRGVYSAKVWLPVSDFGDLDDRHRVDEWTTDGWETVNYYALNHKNIGLGYKIYELSKAKHAELFSGADTFATLELSSGRFATLFIERSASF